MIITNISTSNIIFSGSYSVAPNGGTLSVANGEIPDVQIAALINKGYITVTGWTPAGTPGCGVQASSIVDIIYTDNSGTQFVYRDNGAVPPVFTAYTVPGGVEYVPTDNPRPYTEVGLTNEQLRSIPLEVSSSSSAYTLRTPVKMNIGTTSTLLSSENPIRRKLLVQVNGAADISIRPGTGLATMLDGFIISANTSGSGYPGGTFETDSTGAFQIVGRAPTTILVTEGF